MFASKSLLHCACAAILMACLSSCTHFYLEDCGETILGKDEPRIRSSHFRMLLADVPAASRKLLPYAMMSTLAYADEPCEQKRRAETNEEFDDGELAPPERADFESALSTMGWNEIKDGPWGYECEDDSGLFFRVWQNEEKRQVVVAFRGTSQARDWSQANLYWFTRFFAKDNQYSRTRKVMELVLKHFESPATGPMQFYTTGHSLGGGLAQHALYANPDKVIQAYAFAPSSVTGFKQQSPEMELAACECRDQYLEGETRIFRIYDSYEILSVGRIFHKTFFPPTRHIQEVRFPNKHSHSMKELALYFKDNATKPVGSGPWFAGKGDYAKENKTCTAAFIDRQRASCKKVAQVDQCNKCPR